MVDIEGPSIQYLLPSQNGAHGYSPATIVRVITDYTNDGAPIEELTKTLDLLEMQVTAHTDPKDIKTIINNEHRAYVWGINAPGSVNTPQGLVQLKAWSWS